MLNYAQSQDPEGVRKTYETEDPGRSLPCAIGGVPARGVAPVYPPGSYQTIWVAP